jgi:hypothetical protein
MFDKKIQFEKSNFDGQFLSTLGLIFVNTITPDKDIETKLPTQNIISSRLSLRLFVQYLYFLP